LGDLMEKNLRRGLVLSDGNIEPFFTRPISLVIWVTIVLLIALKLDLFSKFTKKVSRT